MDTNSANLEFVNSVEHINNLEGWKTYFKFQHWGASSLSLHKELDDLLSDLSDYEDYIAEALQGYFLKQFHYSMSEPKQKISILADELMNLQEELIHFKSLVGQEAGLVNIIEDFQSKLLKHQYLIMLTVGYIN
jgi:hypothetical protein